MHDSSRHTSDPRQALANSKRQLWFGISTLFLGLFVICTIGIDLIASASGVIPGQSGVAERGSRLYLLSELARPDGLDGTIAGRVSVLDLGTQREILSLEAGVDLEAVVSSDGSRLYIASVDAAGRGADAGGDHLVAVDTQTGTELWQVALPNRVKYSGGGPSTLVPSPDVRWLYVYSYPWLELEQYSAAGQVPYWFQRIDTNTGQVASETRPVLACGAASTTVSPDGGTLYVTCFGSNEVHFVNIETGQVEQQLHLPEAPAVWGQPGGIAGAVTTPDRRRLYVVAEAFQVVVVDLQQRTIAHVAGLGRGGYGTVANGLVALSNDGGALLVAAPVEKPPGTLVANDLYLFDMHTWQEIRHLRIDTPLVPTTLLVAPDGRSVYGISVTNRTGPLPDPDTVLNVSLTGDPAKEPLVRPGEGIVRIFLGP